MNSELEWVIKSNGVSEYPKSNPAPVIGYKIPKMLGFIVKRGLILQNQHTMKAIQHRNLKITLECNIDGLE